MPRQIVKICITASREGLKNQTYQTGSEKVTDTISNLSEIERERFLGPAAEFLLGAMEQDGFLDTAAS